MKLCTAVSETLSFLDSHFQTIWRPHLKDARMLRELFLSLMLICMWLGPGPCFVYTFVISCFKAILFLGTPLTESFGADRSKDVIVLLCIEALGCL